MLCLPLWAPVHPHWQLLQPVSRRRRKLFFNCQSITMVISGRAYKISLGSPHICQTNRVNCKGIFRIMLSLTSNFQNHLLSLTSNFQNHLLSLTSNILILQASLMHWCLWKAIKTRNNSFQKKKNPHMNVNWQPASNFQTTENLLFHWMTCLWCQCLMLVPCSLSRCAASFPWLFWNTLLYFVNKTLKKYI